MLTYRVAAFLIALGACSMLHRPPLWGVLAASAAAALALWGRRARLAAVLAVIACAMPVYMALVFPDDAARPLSDDALWVIAALVAARLLLPLRALAVLAMVNLTASTLVSFLRSGVAGTQRLEVLGWLALLSVLVVASSALSARIRAEGDIRRLNDALEQRVAERTAELRANERLFATLAAVAPLGICRTDVQGRCTYVNARWLQLAGLSAEDARTDWMRHLHPDDRAWVEAGWRRAVAGGTAFGAEFRFAPPDGPERWIAMQAEVEHDEQGRVHGYVGAFVDIDEPRRAELRFRALLEAAPDGMVIVDESGRIVLVNSQLERTLGWSRDELLGRPAEFLVPEAIRATHQDLRAAYERHPHVRPMGVTRPLTAMHKAGHEIPVEICLSPLETEQGRLVIAAVRDVSERRAAERTVRIAQHALDSSVVAIAFADEQGRIEYANRAFLRLWGYTDAQEVIGRPVSDFWVKPEQFESISTAVLGGSGWIGEVIGIRCDGTYVPMQVSANLVLDADGRPLRLMGTFQDLTPLRLSEQRLARAQQIAHLGNWDWNISADTLWWSDEIYRMFGLAPQEFGATYTAFLEYIHDADRQRVIDAVSAAVGPDPSPYSIDHRIVRPDGSVRIVHEQADVEFDGTGRAVRMIGTVHDVTEQREAAEALQRSREHLHAVVSSLPLVIAAFDRGGTFELSEGLGLSLMGLKPGEAVGRSFSDLFGDMPGATDAFARALQGEAVRFESRMNEVILEAVYGPLRDRGGNIAGVIVVAWDITARVLTARALEDSDARLRQAQKMEAVGQLAGGIAHDFNNLLSVIVGYNEMMLEELPPHHRARAAGDEVARAAARATALTRQLLAFSRRQVLQPRVVNLSEIVGDIGKMLERLIGEHIDFAVDVAGNRWHVKADPGQIEQVIVNLVVNARDAMPAGGTIRLAITNEVVDHEVSFRDFTLPPGEWVLITVSDTGVGMDDETQRRVFEPFFTTKAPGKGTGLGLATVYGIVRQSGGHVHVSSVLGHGTAFTIWLPRSTEAPHDPRGAATPLTETSIPATILVVEDHASVRELARQYLGAAGYDVLEATNGQEALRIADTHPGPIHLVLTDVVMPEMGGVELVRALTRTRPEVCVVYTSGYTQDPTLLGGVSERSVHFVEKPFSRRALLAGVAEALKDLPRS